MKAILINIFKLYRNDKMEHHCKQNRFMKLFAIHHSVTYSAGRFRKSYIGNAYELL